MRRKCDRTVKLIMSDVTKGDVDGHAKGVGK